MSDQARARIYADLEQAEGEARYLGISVDITGDDRRIAAAHVLAQCVAARATLAQTEVIRDLHEAVAMFVDGERSLTVSEGNP